MLVVEGAIVNLTEQERAVPPIRVTLLDAAAAAAAGAVRAKERHLQPGAKTSFSGRLINPAEQARNYSVTFELGS